LTGLFSLALVGCLHRQADRSPLEEAACAELSDPAASALAERLRLWTAGYTEPSSAKADTVRVRYGLPLVAKDSVRVIGDRDTCARAGAVYLTETAQRPVSSSQTIVVAAGDRFVVRSLTHPGPAGEFATILILDRRFRVVSTVWGF
jgi:hypothetical protein